MNAQMSQTRTLRTTGSVRVSEVRDLIEDLPGDVALTIRTSPGDRPYDPATTTITVTIPQPISGAEASLVHNHLPWRPVCAERITAEGKRRGACLNDDGTERNSRDGGAE